MDSFINWCHSLFHNVYFDEIILYDVLYNRKKLNSEQIYNLIKTYYKHNTQNNNIINGKIKKYKIINH